MNESISIEVPSIHEMLIHIAKTMVSAQKIGWYATPYINTDKIESNYLNYLIALIKNACDPQYIAYRLDCEFARIITNQKDMIDKDLIEQLLITKHLAVAIQHLDWNAFFGFSDRACDGKTKDAISIILRG